ncbi:unnamed protein product [Symbiodinium sp. CCMP2592]|nr:unnamed protein product [Symbiodinium sp. CCMP2592]
MLGRSCTEKRKQVLELLLMMETLCSLRGCFTAFERLWESLRSKPLRSQQDENQADDSCMTLPSPQADSMPEDCDVASYYPSESWSQEWLANEKTWQPDAQQDVFGGDTEGSTSTPDTSEARNKEDLESDPLEGDVNRHDEQVLQDKVAEDLHSVEDCAGAWSDEGDAAWFA